MGKNKNRALLEEWVSKVSTKLESNSSHGVQALSDASRSCFKEFMRGYANVIRSGPHKQEEAQLIDLLDEAADDPCLDRGRTLKSADHYDYFGKLQTHRLANLEDNGKRLNQSRKNMNTVRKIARSKDQETKPNWFRDVVARVNSLGRPTGDFINSLLAASDDETQAEEDRRQANTSSRKSVKGATEASPHRATILGHASPEANKANTSSNPGSVAAAAAAEKKQKEENRQREACESLRFLVFGTVGEGKRSKDSRAFYEQRCGSREEVIQLHRIWCQMDEDGSGDVEFQEFLNFFSRSKADRLLGMRCVKYLVGNAVVDDDGAPAGCRIEDMMKLIWLKAQKEDVHQMMSWFKEAEFEKDRVPTPPLLPPKKRRQIMENFPLSENGTRITWSDLQDSGLVDASMVKDLREKYGNTYANNRITEEQLLEMLCPNGYRAHEGVMSVMDKDGNMLVKVDNELFTGWVAADNMSLHDNSAK